MKNVPDIRFDGFTDAWEQRKLGDLAVEVKRKADKDSNAPVMMISASEGFIDQSQRYSNNNAGSSLKNYTLLYEGELAYNHGYSKFRNFGSVFDLKVEKARIPFVYHSFALPEDDHRFFAYYLNSGLFDGELKKLVSSTARMDGLLNISYEDYMSIHVLRPPVQEQEIIGRFLTSLDSLITLHQRKYDKLVQFKASMLENLFPKNGSNKPKIRFDGFTDAWEQRKFGDQYQKITEKNDLSFGADKIISVANMYFKSDVKQSDDDYMRTYNIMRLGDIAFEGNKSKHFAHGRFVENTIGDGIVSHVFDVFRPIADYDLLFWKYLINNEGVMGRIMTRCTKASTMMTNLVADDFLAESILVPSIQEQQKIGAFLDKLDSLITLHQRKLEKLKQFKAAMLEKMFV